MKNAVVLWTGGKDSCLALHLALEKKINILALVTFVPQGNREFRAHPQSEIKFQAGRMGLDVYFKEIKEPYKSSYINALKWIKEDLDASIVISGDIDLVGGLPNWIEECCDGLEIDVFQPLWQKSREWVMGELLAREIKAKITWLNHPLLPREWLNRIIDKKLLTEMKSVSSSIGFDLTGENGEYHTMVISAPAFVSVEEDEHLIRHMFCLSVAKP